MVEPTSVLSVLGSVSNALLTLCKHGLHYAEIPEEIEQFRHSIESLQDLIKTTKRLRRVKSHYLDSITKEEVDTTVQRSESVLESISRTIEGCRADLDTKGTIRVRNRIDWLLRGHASFMSRGLNLNSCLQCLSAQIGRLDAAVPPSASPPSYLDVTSSRQPIRAPSKRPLLRQTPQKVVDEVELPLRPDYTSTDTRSQSLRKCASFVSSIWEPQADDYRVSTTHLEDNESQAEFLGLDSEPVAVFNLQMRRRYKSGFI